MHFSSPTPWPNHQATLFYQPLHSGKFHYMLDWRPSDLSWLVHKGFGAAISISFFSCMRWLLGGPRHPGRNQALRRRGVGLFWPPKSLPADGILLSVCAPEPWTAELEDSEWQGAGY